MVEDRGSRVGCGSDRTFSLGNRWPPNPRRGDIACPPDPLAEKRLERGYMIEKLHDGAMVSRVSVSDLSDQDGGCEVE